MRRRARVAVPALVNRCLPAHVPVAPKLPGFPRLSAFAARRPGSLSVPCRVAGRHVLPVAPTGSRVEVTAQAAQEVGWTGVQALWEVARLVWEEPPRWVPGLLEPPPRWVPGEPASRVCALFRFREERERIRR